MPVKCDGEHASLFGLHLRGGLRATGTCMSSLLDSCKLVPGLKCLFYEGGKKGQLPLNSFNQLFFVAKLYEIATDFSLQVINRATDEWY